MIPAVTSLSLLLVQLALGKVDEVVVPTVINTGIDENEVKEVLISDGDNNPFALHMFENFELTRQIFEREKEAVKTLERLRSLLKARRGLIQSFLNRGTGSGGSEGENGPLPSHHNPIDAFSALKRTGFAKRQELEALVNNAEEVNKIGPLQDLFERNETQPIKMPIAEKEDPSYSARKNSSGVQNDTPLRRDFIGALNGIVILYDTYRFGMDEFRREGRIRIGDFVSGDDVDLVARHNVTSDDLYRLAAHAYSKTWYDVAVEFSRAYFRSVEESADGGQEANLEKMKRLRKILVKLNNGYLQKRRTMADKDFKVLPQLLDSKLREKKKQPGWMLKEGILLANRNSNQGKEAYFR